MLLTKEDVEFISQKTRLSIRKTKLLTEEERDLSLILDQLSSGSISKEEIAKLSFPTIIKYVVFKHSKDFNFPLPEKIYVCQIIEKHFPVIARSKIFRSFPKDRNNKDFAEYCLILVGLFSHKLKPEEYKKYKNYLIFFKTDDFPTLYDKFDSWVSVFTKMKTQELFS